MIVGYARVSTNDQQAGLEAQLVQLASLGVEKVFSEQTSAVGHRKALDDALELPTGKLMIGLLACIAEFERSIMLERQRDGIAAAKAQGKYRGRVPTARRKADTLFGDCSRMG